ncbi:hypothetical protein TASIC1_0006039000 [Trichoderma asperellum]|uniref:Uncharacterized protein n=1 Tax=Trichoderma asperellum TaxID=101201 RepID=A0A6V8QV23_TRIAP|nr:hypothetical protein TASIC1_0006039000 [Trichoderma asperellum]
MDLSQLPDVSNLLVTADNPARDDIPGMDHERCAALHNYLLHYAWLAEGHPSSSLRNITNTFFTAHGTAAEQLRPRLNMSLATFLDTAKLPPAGPERPPFFFWASGLSDPELLFEEWLADMFDQPADSLVWLYFPNIGQGGEFGGGVLYHQRHHRAAVFMHMDDHGFALPLEEHRELWHPLETVLSNWIDLIRLGKVTASPRDEPALFGSEKIGPWEWRPYGEAQVVSCISAWNRLCEAIEVRMPSQPPSAADLGPLLAPAVLDEASVPQDCFSRSFLTTARRPLFDFIAPGLTLPPADSSAFAAVQPFTKLSRGCHTIPSVCIFPAAGGEEVDLTGSSYLFSIGIDDSVPSRVVAGVYSEPVERNNYDYAEEGFRLLLPYGFRGDWDASLGARKSDGSTIERNNGTGLFQHGYKPFGGDYYRAQRLERLFDCWCKLVDEGVWSVGPQGIKGTIDTFKEADTERWRDYIIPPTW